MHHQPGQKYYYFSHMNRGEVLFLKVYDSVDDGKKARFMAHTAFRDLTFPAHPVLRESVEVRTVAFFAPSEDNKANHNCAKNLSFTKVV